MLTRLKLAAGLMRMNWRTDKVSEDDWDLAGVILAVSKATRASVLTEMRSNETKAAHARGRRDAEREVVKGDVLRDIAIARIADGIREKLRAENHQKVNRLRHRFRGPGRPNVWPRIRAFAAERRCRISNRLSTRGIQCTSRTCGRAGEASWRS